MKTRRRQDDRSIDLGLAVMNATQPRQRYTYAQIGAFAGMQPSGIQYMERRALKKLSRKLQATKAEIWAELES